VRGWLLVLIMSTCACVPGCANRPPKEATATATTSPTTLPAAPTVTSANFDRLWNACADVARDRQFVIDRQDYRGGVLTTSPLISAQFFEPWRRDALTGDAVAESSLASIRRTIRFDFERRDDGTFSVVPSVTVERYSAAERRITSAMLYRSAFRKTTATGTRESDRGIAIPGRYWYRIGSDPVLEKDLAEAVRRRV
jgi:hypothetical protein